MIADWIASPPVALALFLALGVLGYRWVGRRSPRGSDSPGKRQPYACGEDLSPTEIRLSYRRFFRLALMFVVVHMATLVVAFLPRSLDVRLLATGYLLGIGVCVDILIRRDR